MNVPRKTTKKSFDKDILVRHIFLEIMDGMCVCVFLFACQCVTGNVLKS